jgi:ketosteroid isomerase-like protein
MRVVATLRDAYAAFNRGDIDAAVAGLAPQIEWSEPESFPGGGTYHGRDGAKRYLAQSRAAWAEVISEAEQFIDAGDRIVVFVHARVRAKGSNDWQEVRLADVYRGARREDRRDACLCGPPGSAPLGGEIDTS